MEETVFHHEIFIGNDFPKGSLYIHVTVYDKVQVNEEIYSLCIYSIWDETGKECQPIWENVQCLDLGKEVMEGNICTAEATLINEKGEVFKIKNEIRLKDKFIDKGSVELCFKYHVLDLLEEIDIINRLGYDVWKKLREPINKDLYCFVHSLRHSKEWHPKNSIGWEDINKWYEKKIRAETKTVKNNSKYSIRYLYQIIITRLKNL